MKKKSFIIATCLVLAILSFLVLPAYASASTQDPITLIFELIQAFIELLRLLISFLVGLVKAFLAFLAQLFGA